MKKQYVDFSLESAVSLLGIDSPTGYADRAIDAVRKMMRELGYKVIETNKGGILVDLGGSDAENAVLLQAHVDTLGAMVAEVQGNGRLRTVSLGGLRPENAEGENVRVYTRDGRAYDGCFHIRNASVHVNDDYAGASRKFDNCEVLLDEPVKSAEDTRALGVEVGDIIAFSPRTVVTEKGYIKSRFLDDKLSAGILCGLAKYIHDEKKTPARRTYLHFTVFEEVGFGGNASVPAGVTESLSVDMGCVGDGLSCTEREVSICVRDSGGPYHYGLTTELINEAKAAGVRYALDVYPHYGSDVEATVNAGYDIRHGLVGPGVYASHGYERSHVDGVENTLLLLCAHLHIL